MRKYLHIHLGERSVRTEALHGEAIIRAGRNYGWPIEVGTEPGEPYTNPAWESDCPTIAPSGATFVTGANWGSFEGRLFVATLKEQGINVEIGNWRGVYGAAGITPAQRDALTDMIVKATKSKAWADALVKNNWTPALLTGKAFDEFVDRDFSSLRATMVRAGMA